MILSLRTSYVLKLSSKYTNYNIPLKFSTTNELLNKIVPKNLKGKKKSSQEWLTRQLNDPYVKMASINNYRLVVYILIYLLIILNLCFYNWKNF